MLLQKFAN